MTARRARSWDLMAETGLGPLRLLQLALFVAALFSVLFTIQGALTVRPATTGRFVVIFAWQAIPWFLWAGLALPIFWLLDRLDPADRPPAQAVAIHLMLGAAVALLHSVLVRLIAFALGLTGATASVVDQILRGIQYNWITQLVQYGIIATAYHLLRAVVDYRRTREAVLRRDEQLAAARLEALHRQIQPHFLFNALNAASAAARTGSGRDAARLIAALGDLLRGAMALGDRAEIALEEELEFLEQFLLIQRTRFADRLTVHLAIAPETRRAPVPPLLVQTLVENAIKHGVARLDGPATVTIRSALADGRLRLEVENDGPPPVAQSAERLGTGMSNVRARLRELHGDTADVTLRPRSGNDGTVAVVELPVPGAWRAGPAGAHAPATPPALP